MKKILAFILAVSMTAAFSGCNSEKNSNSETTTSAAETQSETVSETVGENISENTSESDSESTSARQDENSETKFILEYPADVQAMGYTEPVVLDKAPERVVCLSTAPVLALYELGVNMVGVPNSMVVSWPEDLKNNAATVSFSVMSPEDFDYESVVALEPDLVMLSAVGAETAGEKLESFGIKCYYLNAGHTVSYESIKMQTKALIDAFDQTDEAKKAGEEIMQRFSDLEASIANAKTAFSGKTVMVLQGSADSQYIQTSGGTLGSMLDMIGFENVFTNEGSSMVQLNYEEALDYNPDYVVCVGSTDAQTHKATMDGVFASNPEYWNAIPAVAEGKVICLDVTYVSTAGINVIDNIANLIGIMSENTGIKVE